MSSRPVIPNRDRLIFAMDVPDADSARRLAGLLTLHPALDTNYRAVAGAAAEWAKKG